MNTDNLQSRFYALRHNRFFEIFVIAVIVFSALVIGAKTYAIPENVLTIIGWLDTGITLFFFGGGLRSVYRRAPKKKFL